MNKTHKFAINTLLLYVIIKAIEGLVLMIKDIAVYFIQRLWK